MGINRTASAFTVCSVCLEMLWTALETGSGLFAREGSSTRSLEGPEYQYPQRSFWKWAVCERLVQHSFPTLVRHLCSGQELYGGLHWKLYFSFLELFWDNTGECELKSLIKVSSASLKDGQCSKSLSVLAGLWLLSQLTTNCCWFT